MAFLRQQIGEAESAKKENNKDVDFLSSIEVTKFVIPTHVITSFALLIG